MRLARGLVLGACLLGGNAAAQPGQPAFPPPSPTLEESAAPVRLVSLTATPFSIPWAIWNIRANVVPIPSLQLEVRAHPRVGVAVMALAGDDTYTAGGFTDHGTFYEIGAEPRYYFKGGFRGAMAGVALHYYRLHMDLIDQSDPTFILSFDFAGYTYGPFAGYKFTARNGFTAEAKGGLVGGRRTMSDSGKNSDLLPIVDARIGWSF
jgi:hypothetical protein